MSNHSRKPDVPVTSPSPFRRRAEDPLAELARLIGQDDPFADLAYPQPRPIADRVRTPRPARVLPRPGVRGDYEENFDYEPVYDDEYEPPSSSKNARSTILEKGKAALDKLEAAVDKHANLLKYNLGEDQRFTLTDAGYESDRAIAHQASTQALQKELRRKSNMLVEQTTRLSNQYKWQGLHEAAKLASDILSKEPTALANEIPALWSVSVSIGCFLEQDTSAQNNLSGDIAPLAPDVTRSLRDFTTTCGAWLRAFPTARKLDEESRAFQATDDQIATAESFLAKAREADLVQPKDAKVISVALQASKLKTRLSQKARTFILVTASALALAFLTTITNTVATRVAAKSTTVAKLERVVLAAEKNLWEIFEHLPSDIRAALRSVLDRAQFKTK